MRKIHLGAAALALGVPLLSTSPAPAPSEDAAPEIDAGKWFNHIGRAPTLAGLRGHAVLLEFWATW